MGRTAKVASRSPKNNAQAATGAGRGRQRGPKRKNPSVKRPTKTGRASTEGTSKRLSMRLEAESEPGEIELFCPPKTYKQWAAISTSTRKFVLQHLESCRSAVLGMSDQENYEEVEEILNELTERIKTEMSGIVVPPVISNNYTTAITEYADVNAEHQSNKQRSERIENEIERLEMCTTKNEADISAQLQILRHLERSMQSPD